MAAPAALSSPLQRGSSGHSSKWLAGIVIILLSATAVVLSRSRHHPDAHHLARGFFATTTQNGNALPKVQGEPRRGRTPAEEQLWLQLHDRFAMEAQELEKLGVDLVFYGDSITEAMRGTTMGYPNEKHAATPAIVRKHYGHVRMTALSLAGDTTLNLLWRVQNGEGPFFSPKVAVVLIGTNDLTNPLYQLDIDNPSATGAVVAAGAVAAVQEMLQQSSRMHVVLLAVTPRGERFLFTSALEKYRQPSRFSPAIAATNAQLQRFADGQERVTYVDCNAVLLRETFYLMMDNNGLAPNSEALQGKLECLAN